MPNTHKILIVDDDKDFLEVLVTKFKARNYETYTALNGEEAVVRAKEILPDLILMDVKMPKMDGIAAMLKLKEDPVTKNIKVVLLTAFGDPQPEIYKTDKNFARELGAFEYLLKTQDLDELADRTREFFPKN